jgi:WD40 repeat protein
MFFYVSYGFEAFLEKKIKASGAVSDIVYSNGKIYVATERSKVDVIDLSKKEIIKSYEYPYFEDFMGELQPAKVFSADVSPDGKKLIATVQGIRGSREVYLLDLTKDGKPVKIVSRKAHLPINKLRFVSNNKVVFGLSGDEVILYDIDQKKQLYRISVGMSFFSDMAIDTDKKLVAVVDESGDTHIVDVEQGKVIRNLEEMNKDKAFSVDIKNRVVISGGRDKKASVFDLKTGHKKEFLADDFMVFSVGLSQDGKLGAYLYNDKYDVAVVDISTGEKIGFLKGHVSTPGRILFIENNTIITGCDNGEIYIWRIKR